MIILAAAEGTAINAIARQFGVSRPTVYLWRDRFRQAASSGWSRMRRAPGAGVASRLTRSKP